MSQHETNRDDDNSSPAAEAPDMEPKQTGQSTQSPAEGGLDSAEEAAQSTGQSSDAPVTG